MFALEPSRDMRTRERVRRWRHCRSKGMRPKLCAPENVVANPFDLLQGYSRSSARATRSWLHSIGGPFISRYRHWASADESQLEQFGEVSYMMVRPPPQVATPASSTVASRDMRTFASLCAVPIDSVPTVVSSLRCCIPLLAECRP